METMNILLPVTLAVALVIVILALLTFIQNAQLMLVNSKYELNLLGILGYSYSSVSRVVMKKFNKLFALIILISIPLVLVFKWMIDFQFKQELEIDLGFGLSWIAGLIGLTIYGIFYVIQLNMIKTYVKNIISDS